MNKMDTKTSKASIPNLVFTQAEVDLKNYVTKDPTLIVKGYLDVYFDLPLFQKLVSLYGSQEYYNSAGSIDSRANFMGSFIRKNPNFLGNWGYDLSDIIKEADENDDFWFSTNDVIGEGVRRGSKNQNIKMKFERLLMNHVMMSQEIQTIRFICDSTKEMKELKPMEQDVSSSYKFSAGMLIYFLYRPGRLSEKNFANSTCKYPTIPIWYDNGVLNITMTSSPK